MSEQPLVLPAELRGVVVADAVAGAGGVEVLAEEEAAGFLEAELLLELQGAHRRHRLEMVVESRDAHPELPRQPLDAQRLVEIPAQPFDGLRDVRDGIGPAAEERDVTEAVSL